jgi:hypothetical protein
MELLVTYREMIVDTDREDIWIIKLKNLGKWRLQIQHHAKETDNDQEDSK